MAVRRSFTLVEILIVVLILAILAGIVVPQFADTTESAKAKALLADLHVVRKQLLAYQLEHEDFYPELAQMWDSLTGQTDINGDPGVDYGPYVDEAAVNPFTGGSACAADNTADWEYDEVTGAIRAVLPADAIADYGLSNADVVAEP